MDAAIEYKSATASEVDQLRIGDKEQIDRVRFAPEMKGPEGLEALRRARHALSTDEPIVISGYRAQNIRSQPRFKQYITQIQDIFTRRPVYYYEPVELFRYRMPQCLVTHSFKGDIGSIKDFYSEVRSGNHQKAIDKLPRFMQPFVEAQFNSLLSSKSNLPNRQNQIQTSRRVHDAWREARTDQGYRDYISRIIDEAGNTPDNAVIPPVPPILRSSSQDVITRTVGYNDLNWDLCKSSFEDSSVGTTTAYLHFYIDQGVFVPSSNNDQRVLAAIRNQLTKRPYAGIAVTVSKLSKVWNNGNSHALERFFSELEVISNNRSIPLVAPRSGYYGMYLTDYGVDIFSSLMNGNLELNSSGIPGEVAKYGKIPIYDECVNAMVDRVANVLVNRQGRLYSVQGIPDSPQIFNPNGDSLESRFGTDRHYRVTFGKQRRLLHLKEAEEIRTSVKNGTANPATHHFVGSNHPHLS